MRSLIISLGAIYTGYNFGSYSFVEPTMEYVLDNNSSYVNGLCNALVTIGIAVGSLSTHPLVHKILKRRLLLVYCADLLGIFASSL